MTSLEMLLSTKILIYTAEILFINKVLLSQKMLARKKTGVGAWSLHYYIIPATCLGRKDSMSVMLEFC